MKVITVGVTPTLISTGGTIGFIHIYNNSSASIYLCYDGSDYTTLTINNGMPVGPNGMLVLENARLADGGWRPFTSAIYAISQNGGAEVRIQSA